jgi:hypothetical protein
MKELIEIKKCPITEDTESIKYFDLGNFPLVNNLNNTKYESLNCKKYPLQLNLFTKSKITMLGHCINPDLLFKNYLFKSEVNKPYITHCKNMLSYLTDLIDIELDDLIIDIGGNDGTLLNTFKENLNKKVNYLNIDPSKNLTEISEKKGIDVFNEFFSLETAKKINKNAKIIISTNVFQHLENINSFVEGVYHLLNDDGIWLLEFPYWIHDLETNQFDQIYHEHIYYYSIIPLNLLMQKHNLKIVRVEKQNIHGGTLRLIIVKENSNLKSDNSLQYFIKYEKNIDIKYYLKWGDSIKEHLNTSKNIIKDLKKQGKKIAAFGAAAKGCIFLNSIGITDEEIEFIIDDTDIKQGKYMPGTGIKIVSREFARDKKIDYIIILAHNFAEHIIESFKGCDYRFITFLPKIKIYE